MTTLCKEFSDSSDYIFNWFSAKQNVKEESFTDWFLYNLSLKLPSFKFKEFTRREENAISGADFDFWIIGRTKTLAFRIQAKKLKRTGNHYDAISYPSQSKGQINLLLSSSVYPFRPFYLFYNNIACGKCIRQTSGTLLTDARVIQSAFLGGSRIMVTRQDILDISIPLECLFCCQLHEYGDDVLKGIENVLEHYFPSNEMESSGIIDSIPEYVEDIMNNETTDEQWLERYRNQIAINIKYVAVLDLRKI